jgi:hypothetical protein
MTAPTYASERPPCPICGGYSSSPCDARDPAGFFAPSGDRRCHECKTVWNPDKVAHVAHIAPADLDAAYRRGWSECLAACEVALLEACTTGEGDDDDAYCSGWMQGAKHQNRADAQAIRALTPPPDLGAIKEPPMTDPRELATHLDAVADLHDGQDGSPITRDLLRDAANALRAAVVPAEPWKPPVEREPGYRCQITIPATWEPWGTAGNGCWVVTDTHLKDVGIPSDAPTAFAPLPEGQP